MNSFVMNILTHAIAKRHGLYDISDPEGSPGLKDLIDSRIKQPIGADWGYYLTNSPLHEQARLPIFGYYDGVQSSALDMARLGWLWRNWGHWLDRQVIPEAWLREAVQVNPDIRRHSRVCVANNHVTGVDY
jgi:CubicO group peptidase (beta-lactamase class C family)